MKRDRIKLTTGKSRKELVRQRQGRQKTRDNYFKGLHSKDKLLLLGHGSEGDVYITEGERESHIHILGSPGSGKSKLIEYFIRHDIDRLKEEWNAGVKTKEGRACGLCLLDPSEDGETINKVLAYCEEIGFEKIILIDPLRYGSHSKLPAINIFDSAPTFWESSINYMVDAFRVVYEVEDLSKTSYIKTYLSALFGLFHFAKLPASDLIYFTEPPDNAEHPIKELELYERKRAEIFELARRQLYSNDFPGKWRDIGAKYLAGLQIAYKNLPNFTREVGSTARRLNTLVNPALRQILGHRNGLNFDKLVSDGWIILVNVSTGGALGDLEARLLGTIVINQIISSIKRIRRHGFNKPYYLYIDEAGQFVTYTLADILAHKRKIGLRTVLAHQFLGQLDNDFIRDAIVKCTGIKCGFYIEDADEREKMVRMLGYGGELKPSEVSHNLGTQKKQEMVVRLSKQSPALLRVPNVSDPDGNVKEIVSSIFERPWYYNFADLKEDERERFKTVSSENSKGYQSRKKTDGKTTGTAAVPGRVQGEPKKDLPPDNEKPRKDGKRKPLDMGAVSA